MMSPNSLFWTISCPNVCDPKHCVNCVYSEVCMWLVQSRHVLSWLLFLFCVRRFLFLLASYCTTLADYVKTLMQPLMEWSFINVRV